MTMAFHKMAGMQDAQQSAMYPGAFGDPAEDCKCCCTTLTRARWALGEDELKTLQDRARFFGLDKSEGFEEHKKKYLTKGFSSGRAGDTDGYTTIDEVIPIDFFDNEAIQKTVFNFFNEYANSNIEHAAVISPDGNLYKLTGSKGNVNIGLVGDSALYGSITVHNHPIIKGLPSGDSFSIDDVSFLVEKKMGKAYLVTGTKQYLFEYTGNLNKSEIVQEYKNALNEALELAWDTDTVLEYRQETTMRILSNKLEGFIFNEDIRR